MFGGGEDEPPTGVHVVEQSFPTGGWDVIRSKRNSATGREIFNDAAENLVKLARRRKDGRRDHVFSAELSLTRLEQLRKLWGSGVFRLKVHSDAGPAGSINFKVSEIREPISSIPASPITRRQQSSRRAVMIAVEQAHLATELILHHRRSWPTPTPTICR